MRPTANLEPPLQHEEHLHAERSQDRQAAQQRQHEQEAGAHLGAQGYLLGPGAQVALMAPARLDMRNRL